MNYQKTYNLLINKAINRTLIDGYFEVHHIVPKSLGGSNDKSNLVKLTAREHFIAHCLLARIYGGSQWASVVCMKASSSGMRVVSSRMYNSAKKQFADYQRQFMTGKKLSEKTRIKMSTRLMGNTHTKGVQLSEEHKAKMRKPKPLLALALKGIKHTEARKANTSIAIKQWWAIRKAQQEKVMNHG